MKRHGIVSHVEFLIPEFDETDAYDEALIERMKAHNDVEPDPYRKATFQRLNFGDLS